MQLSIRNQLPGTVTGVTPGEVMATVRVHLSGGQDVTAAITLDAVEDLGIAVGTEVRVLAKATEVALATGPVEGLSIRNRLTGKLTEIVLGTSLANVKLTVGETELTAVITREAVEELGLTPGTAVTALIKSTEISLGSV
ncbi:molybdenum-binding protein [Streptomyces camponoticapitis]|uniref:Molybdenum-binding protein n=1 Tax=Streptomyces camponoticapitis TaxID=1616125 RepID=A0ABQ2EED8_9ACTN|nr:TOBE domain-containing protein [Streptomyces camponoticapitis]GGK08105.1 molybdenum-binding protein [Streptomyces camponoticapitis]